jgi:amino acid transporter
LAFVAIWCQWVQIMVWYPTVLAVCAVSIAYMINPSLEKHTWFTVPILLAVFWFATIINFKGIRFSGWFTTACLYAGTFIPVLLAIALAIWWVSSGRPSAISLDAADLVPDLSSVSAIVGAVAVFSFLSGLEVNAVHFRKVRNPQRSIPIALLISGTLVLLVSVLGALSVAVLVPVDEIDLAAGTLQVFQRVFAAVGLNWLLPILAFLALAGMIGHIMVWVIGPTESLRLEADDGLIPPYFQKTTPDGAPRNVMIVQAIVVSLICLLGLALDLNQIFYVLTIISAQIYLVMYALMFISLIRLRITHDKIKRSFRIPGGLPGVIVVGGVGLLGCLGGIVFGFIPPNQADMALSAGTLLPMVIGGFGLAVILPFVFYRFRNPAWGKNASLPHADDTKTMWKRGD